MKSKVLITSITCLIIGFSAAYFIFDAPPAADNAETAVIHTENKVNDEDNVISSPFFPLAGQHDDNARLTNLENEISQIRQQLQKIQLDLREISSSMDTTLAGTHAAPANNQGISLLSRRLFSYDNLIKGGIEPGIAEDIARRKNAIELKKLELQDRATRGGYLDTQRYYDELANINSQGINLRDELGDDLYDEYLYNSKQNNRIRITAVMLGSAAEQAGIKKDDIVLSYDNERMFTWDELKSKTTEGQLGEYVTISVYRNGEIFSFSVPRGPLGTQLGATRMPPH